MPVALVTLFYAGPKGPSRVVVHEVCAVFEAISLERLGRHVLAVLPAGCSADDAPCVVHD